MLIPEMFNCVSSLVCLFVMVVMLGGSGVSLTETVKDLSKLNAGVPLSVTLTQIEYEFFVS